MFSREGRTRTHIGGRQVLGMNLLYGLVSDVYTLCAFRFPSGISQLDRVADSGRWAPKERIGPLTRKHRKISATSILRGTGVEIGG